MREAAASEECTEYCINLSSAISMLKALIRSGTELDFEICATFEMYKYLKYYDTMTGTEASLVVNICKREHRERNPAVLPDLEIKDIPKRLIAHPQSRNWSSTFFIS